MKRWWAEVLMGNRPDRTSRDKSRMRLKRLLSLLVLSGLLPISASAHHRFIVRDTEGLDSLQEACEEVGCTVVQSLDGHANHVFLITFPSEADLDDVLPELLNARGVINVERD